MTDVEPQAVDPLPEGYQIISKIAAGDLDTYLIRLNAAIRRRMITPEWARAKREVQQQQLADFVDGMVTAPLFKVTEPPAGP